MGGRRAAVALILAFGGPATPAFADTAGPKLVVAGTLLRADGATVEASPLTVDPAASDPDGVRSIALTVDGVAVAGGGPWRIDPKDYGDGAHRIVVTATDDAGNTSTEQADVRFTHASPVPRDACGWAAAARSSSTARGRMTGRVRRWPRSATSTATAPRTCSSARPERTPRTSSAAPAAGAR